MQSGLLMMPQAMAAMSLKLTMPRILARFGYRTVLISNTLILGVLIMLFATIGVGTPVWLHRRCRPSSSASSPRCNTPA